MSRLTKEGWHLGRDAESCNKLQLRYGSSDQLVGTCLSHQHSQRGRMKTQPDPCLKAASEISHMAAFFWIPGPFQARYGGFSEIAARVFSAVTTAEIGNQELVQNQQVCSEIAP